MDNMSRLFNGVVGLRNADDSDSSHWLKRKLSFQGLKCQIWANLK